MRRYGYIPSPNAADNTPAVSAVTGLGNGGASVQTPDSGNFGDVLVYAGPGATAGSLDITFPDTPPDLFVSGEEAFGTITQATDTNTVTISWTAALPARSAPYVLHYEWLDPNKAN